MLKKIISKIRKLTIISSSKKKYYRKQSVIDRFFKAYMSEVKMAKTLDIGSGPSPRNPFNAKLVFGADIRENLSNNVLYADFSKGLLPFDDNAFDYVTAYDVLEHIQRVSSDGDKTIFPFILLMNEVFRILKPGGVFFSLTPCYPYNEAFQDPTHVNIMTEDTIETYFCGSAWARIYGYNGSFTMLQDGWISSKYFAFIKKSSQTPVNDLFFVQK